MHTGSSFEMNNTNLQPRQPPPSSIGGQDAPSSLRRNGESSRSILSMARDAVGGNLSEELDDSYQSLHDSGGSGGGGWGDARGGGGSVAGKSGGGLGAALAQHKLKMSSQDKDADSASTHSDFSTGRCYHDIAGKTSVLMEDKELYAKFQASLKEKGIKTGVGVKMALQEFVAEHVTDVDVARFEAAKRQKELAASGAGGGGQSFGSSRSLRERVGSLGSLLHGSRQSLMGSSTNVGDPPASLGHNDSSQNASWNLSRSFDPALANTGMKKSESFNNLIGDALGKLGLAAETAGTAAPPTDVEVGRSIMAGLRRLSGASTSSATSCSTSQMSAGDANAQSTATSSHRQSQRGSALGMADAAAAVAAMDVEGDCGDCSDEEGKVELDTLPPRAAERKRRASFGSLGALTMQKNFIDELSDEDDSSLSSSDDEKEVKPSTPGNNHTNKANGDNRSKDGTQGLNNDEDSDYDDDKEYLGDELMVGFGPRPSRR